MRNGIRYAHPLPPTNPRPPNPPAKLRRREPATIVSGDDDDRTAAARRPWRPWRPARRGGMLARPALRPIGNKTTGGDGKNQKSKNHLFHVLELLAYGSF